MALDTFPLDGSDELPEMDLTADAEGVPFTTEDRESILRIWEGIKAAIRAEDGL